MKIDFLQSENRLRSKSPMQSTFDERNIHRKNTALCDERHSIKNNDINGSDMRNNNVAAINFSGKNKEVGKISKWIFKAGPFNSMLRFFENKTAVAQNGVALVVAGGFRPATNILMASDKDREDSYHAATHAISSAGVGFGVTCAVMKPVTDGVKKFKDNPAKYLDAKMAKVYGIDSLGARKVQTSKIFKNTCKFVEMIPEISIGIPKAILTIALIPPILKYAFGIEKGGSKNKTAEAAPKPEPQNVPADGKEVA